MPMIRDEPVVTTLLALILYASFHTVTFVTPVVDHQMEQSVINRRLKWKSTRGGGGGGRRTIYVPIST